MTRVDKPPPNYDAAKYDALFAELTYYADRSDFSNPQCLSVLRQLRDMMLKREPFYGVQARANELFEQHLGDRMLLNRLSCSKRYLAVLKSRWRAMRRAHPRKPQLR